MAIRREGGDACRIALVIFTILLWIGAFALIFIGTWMLVDPKRSYILDLVDFSEDDPLLVFAAYTCICAGVAALFIGFLSCCGAMKRMRAMIILLIGLMFCLFLCGVAVGTLALVYRDKAHSGSITSALRFMIRHEYGVMGHLRRNEKVTELINRMQFHMECCGVASHRDWKNSDWAIDGGAEVDDRLAFWRDQPGEYVPVPETCCKQIEGASALSPSARSLARCQYKDANRLWRHQSGCGPKLHKWFFEQTAIFAGVGFGFAALQVIGIVIAVCLCNQVRYYHYIKSEVY